MDASRQLETSVLRVLGAKFLVGMTPVTSKIYYIHTPTPTLLHSFAYYTAHAEIPNSHAMAKQQVYELGSKRFPSCPGDEATSTVISGVRGSASEILDVLMGYH